MGLFVYCTDVPKAKRPSVALGNVADPNDLLALVDSLTGFSIEQGALWAAAVAAQMHGRWPRIDASSGIVRGTAYKLPENWRLASDTQLQMGLVRLANQGILDGGARDGVVFTTATAKRLIRTRGV